MLAAADGNFESNPVLYINCQMHYHFGFSKEVVQNFTDDEWAEHYAILTHIRKEEAKQRPLG